MAKKTGVVAKVNKAKAIREYQEQNPDAKPAAVCAALAEQGIHVNANYIATVNYHKKDKKKGKVTDYKQAYARLRTAGKAFKSVGGVNSAIKALEQVKQLGQELETTDIGELLEMASSLAEIEEDVAPPAE